MIPRIPDREWWYIVDDVADFMGIYATDTNPHARLDFRHELSARLSQRHKVRRETEILEALEDDRNTSYEKGFQD